MLSVKGRCATPCHACCLIIWPVLDPNCGPLKPAILLLSLGLIAPYESPFWVWFAPTYLCFPWTGNFPVWPVILNFPSYKTTTLSTTIPIIVVVVVSQPGECPAATEPAGPAGTTCTSLPSGRSNPRRARWGSC